MRCIVAGVMVLTTCAASMLWAGADSAGEPIPLKRADLEKPAGVWELKAAPSEGWQGTVRATITLYKTDGKAADFGYILHDFDLAHGPNRLKVANAPSGGSALPASGAVRTWPSSRRNSSPGPPPSRWTRRMNCRQRSSSRVTG